MIRVLESYLANRLVGIALFELPCSNRVSSTDSPSAGIACNRLWRHACVYGIASVRVEMSPWMSEELSVVTGSVPLAWLGVRSMWMELCR